MTSDSDRDNCLKEYFSNGGKITRCATMTAINSKIPKPPWTWRTRKQAIASRGAEGKTNGLTSSYEHLNPRR